MAEPRNPFSVIVIDLRRESDPLKFVSNKRLNLKELKLLRRGTKAG